MHNDGQRRVKPAGKRQFNQKAWDCLDLIRIYTVSSQITGGIFFLPVRMNLAMRDSLRSATPFFSLQIC